MKRILSIILSILVCNKFLFALEKPSSPMLPKKLIYNKQPIEAYCICELIQTALPIDIKKCQEALRVKNPKKEVNNDCFKGFFGCTYNYQEEDLPVHELCYWKYLGSPLAGQFLIYSVYSGGGSGTFSDLSFVSRKEDFLYVERKIDGGDRAEGGVTEPVLKDNKLMYKKAVTPAGLLALGLELIKDNKGLKDIAKPDESLRNCMSCYSAEVMFETDFKNKKIIKTIILLPKETRRGYGAKNSEEKTLQYCMDIIIDKYSESYKSEISPEQFKKFIMEVFEMYKSKG